MSLSKGDKLGPYEIVERIGKGGMGEVYRAHDPRTARDVAIKTSHAEFSERFSREIRAIAALNHPNICQLYDVGPNFLVMELVEGPTLSERIKSGAIPLDETLAIARQITAALEAAHEKGITHRDLKPGNVKVRPDGVVKVLDFGLAKIGAPKNASADPDLSPTLTIGATEAGMILGTASYMAPEQARGKEVDKRADIFAFGVLLYEMVTGERLFTGADISEILAKVIRDEADLTKVPAQLRLLLAACLVKEPSQRLRDIGDVWSLLGVSRIEDAPKPRLPKWLWPAAATALVLVGVTLWAPWRTSTSQQDRPLVRLSVDLGPNADPQRTAVLSPQGTRIVFRVLENGVPRLATRALDQSEVVQLPGTERAGQPFFSPDGEWLAFFADRKLKKIAIQGGAPVTLADIGDGGAFGGTWGDDGVITFSANQVSGLSRVAASGGEPERVSTGEDASRWPQALPGGDAILFTSSTNPFFWDDAQVHVVSLKTKEVKTLQRGGYFGRYVPSAGGDERGHLLFFRDGTLFAAGFDPGRLEILGTPTPVLEDVASDLENGNAHFYASPNGAATYLSGKGGRSTYPISWLDHAGNLQPLLAKLDGYGALRFSPDGTKLAYSAPSVGGSSDVWVYDWQRNVPTQLTFNGPGNLEMAWAPDSKHIAYGARAKGMAEMWWMRSDGSGQPVKLLERKNTGIGMRPQSFTPDGRTLVFDENTGNNAGVEIWTLPLDLTDPDRPKPGDPQRLLFGPQRQVDGALSPDGKWLAYSSNESGTDEIFVRQFPGPGTKVRLSTGTGKWPMWSRAANELFFVSQDGLQIHIVDYTVRGDSFEAKPPRLWSDRGIFRPNFIRILDLHPDGKRFAIFPRSDQPEATSGNVTATYLGNFFDELRRRVPLN